MKYLRLVLGGVVAVALGFILGSFHPNIFYSPYTIDTANSCGWSNGQVDGTTLAYGPSTHIYVGDKPVFLSWAEREHVCAYPGISAE